MMKKFITLGLALYLLYSVAFAQHNLYKPISKAPPKSLTQFKARAVARVTWAEQKVKELGRAKAILFFNQFDQAAPVNDYIFAYVCCAGKNDHFVLANKKQSILFTDFYNHPNHIIMRQAYRNNPNGIWVEYNNPLTKPGSKPKKKYVYVKVLVQYKLCIGSGFSL